MGYGSFFWWVQKQLGWLLNIESDENTKDLNLIRHNNYSKKVTLSSIDTQLQLPGSGAFVDLKALHPFSIDHCSVPATGILGGLLCYGSTHPV